MRSGSSCGIPMRSPSRTPAPGTAIHRPAREAGPAEEGTPSPLRFLPVHQELVTLHQNPKGHLGPWSPRPGIPSSRLPGAYFQPSPTSQLIRGDGGAGGLIHYLLPLPCPGSQLPGAGRLQSPHSGHRTRKSLSPPASRRLLGGFSNRNYSTGRDPVRPTPVQKGRGKFTELAVKMQPTEKCARPSATPSLNDRKTRLPEHAHAARRSL